MTVTLNTANIAAYLAADADADNPNVDPAFDPDEKNWPDRLPDQPAPPTEAELLARLAACTRDVCADCGCEEFCVDYLRASLAEFAAPRFADTLPELPAPWRMSIEALDSWVAFYRSRLRGLGRGCGALTPVEETHRAEVEGQVNSRHDARRHSAFPR